MQSHHPLTLTNRTFIVYGDKSHQFQNRLLRLNHEPLLATAGANYLTIQHRFVPYNLDTLMDSEVGHVNANIIEFLQLRLNPCIILVTIFNISDPLWNNLRKK
jgi:hypothetical protein